MNFVKSIVVTFILVTAPVILESCCFDSCGGCSAKDGPQRYDFTGMTMKAYSRDQFTEVTASAIRLSNIQFVVDIEANYTSMIKTSGSAAYACSPAPAIANQQITSIIITSNNDLTTDLATVSKGQDLSALFQVETEMRRGEINGTVNQQFMGRRLMFFSDVDVSSQQSHILTFKITLDNGDEFEMVTRELNLMTN